MRARDQVGIAAAIVTAALLATDVWPGIRGPENWRWGRRELPSFAPLVMAAFVFAAQIGVAHRIRKVWASGRNRVRLPWLAAAVALSFAAMLVFTAVEPGGLSNVARRVIDPSFTSYHTIARRADDVGDFLSRYPRIQASFPVHGSSQPPGRVLFFRAFNDWAGASAERTERLLAWGDRLGGVPRGLAGTTDAERAGAVAAGFALLMIGALSLVPLVVIVGGRCNASAVGSGVLLMGVLPSFLLFTPQTDHVILLLTMTAAALMMEALRFASRRSAPACSIGAGLCAGLSLFVSFTTLAALGAWALTLTGMVAFGVRRGDPLPGRGQIARIALGAVAGLATPLLIVAALGLDWIAVFRECVASAARVQELMHGRRYSTWVFWNLWDFALFVGPPLAIAVLFRTRDEWVAWQRASRVPHAGRAAAPARGGVDDGVLEAPFAFALLLSVVALDVSGRILGETGRIWMFLMPLAVAAAAVSYGRRSRSAVVPLCAAQWVVLLALRAWVNVPG